MLRRVTLLSIGALVLVYLLTQGYVYLYPSYDASTFLVGAALPLMVSVSLPLLTRSRILLYAFLAFFWALVDDAPVYLDSVFTWPDITRFHPATQHLFLEVLYHVLTAAFLVLTVKEAAKGKKISVMRAAWVGGLTLAAFILAYAQNIPLAWIQDFIETQWYQFDVVEHVASALVLLVAIRETTKLAKSKVAIRVCPRLLALRLGNLTTNV